MALLNHWQTRLTCEMQHVVYAVHLTEMKQHVRSRPRDHSNVDPPNRQAFDLLFWCLVHEDDITQKDNDYVEGDGYD